MKLIGGLLLLGCRCMLECDTSFSFLTKGNLLQGNMYGIAKQNVWFCHAIPYVSQFT